MNSHPFDCKEASFWRGTQLFTGSVSEATADRLWDHAMTCTEPNPLHALATDLWPLADNARARAVALQHKEQL